MVFSDKELEIKWEKFKIAKASEVIQSIEIKRAEYKKNNDILIRIHLDVMKICLEYLPVEDRVAISSRFIEKTSYVEISNRLRLPGKVTSDKGKRRVNKALINFYNHYFTWEEERDFFETEFCNFKE